MKTIDCKECGAEFKQDHFNQKYHSAECATQNRQNYRRKYMREYMARRRETLYFLSEIERESPGDKIKVAYYRAHGLHKFIHEIAKDNQVIALQISGNDVGVVVAEDASEEE